MDEVEDGSAAGEDGSGGQDRAAADDGSLVDAGVAADQHVVFNDYGAGVDGLQDAADLGGGAEVDALADLGAGANQGMGVDHGALIDPGAGIDVHGRHADHAAGDVGSGADGGAAGNHADAVAGTEMADRVGALVNIREAACGQLLKDAETKAEQDALLDPGVDAPAGGRGGVRRGSTEFAALQARTQRMEGRHGGRVTDGGGSGGEVALDGFLELAQGHGNSSLSMIGVRGQGLGIRGSAEGGGIRLRNFVLGWFSMRRSRRQAGGGRSFSLRES